MHVLSFTFGVLSACGAWQPIEWESEKQLRLLYRLFSIATIFIFSILVFLQVILLAVREFDMNFITDVLFTLLPSISFCWRSINFIARRGKIIELADMLLHSYCLPRDSEELRMQKNVDKFIRLFTIVFNGMSQATLFCLLMIPVFQESDQRALPCLVWLPYEISDMKNFWLTWAGEALATCLGVLVNATTDVLISGFVLQACLQLDFMEHRLRQLVKSLKYPLDRSRISDCSIQEFEERAIGETILHHNNIIKFARNVTEAFNLIIIQQFLASALVFSVTIYQLAVINLTNLEIVMALGYLFCFIVELFSYCWFGNEITLKSMKLGDDIYTLDWMSLSKKSKKKLIFIMLRTCQPIEMSCGSIIVLNIESFKKILKVTYSVFNVLTKSATN